MIIGVDTRDLRLAKTGQKTMLEELCRQFRLLEDADTHFYFFDSAFPIYSGRNKFMLMLEHIRQQGWKQLILPFKAWRKKCDVVYCNDYFTPYIHPGFKTVQVFHDAFFYEYPEHYNRIWMLLFRFIAMPAARKSSFIITPSFYARKTVHQYTKLPLTKIVTVYEGAKTLSPGLIEAQSLKWLPIHTGDQYILHVGVMEKRKNLPRLISAFRRFRQEYPSFKLVLVGQGNGKIHSDDTANILAAIQQNGLEDAVILPGYLSDEALGVVYQYAFMYAFPSLNEGFGIPVLEAFSFGLPVIAADNSCLPEIGGEGLLTFDPYDEADIYQKMKRVTDDVPLREALRQAGRERLKLFSWEKAAKEIVGIFARAIAD